MPLQEDRVRQTFQQLGMGDSQVGAFQGQGAFQQPGLFQQDGMFQQGLFQQQEPSMQPAPGAIERQRDDNFLAQFGRGLVSPVTDTLSGLGITNPREMPSSLAGIIGNIAGSIVGWTALTVMTAGIGTKVGLVGAGAAKIGAATSAAGKGIAGVSRGLIAPATGGMIAKGAAWGGLSQAHTWAFGQQEYENIPKEFLVGALTGGAMGGVVGKWTGHLQRSSKLSPTPRGMLTQFAEEYNQRNPTDLISVDDPAKFVQALNSSRFHEALQVQRILTQTNLDTSALKNLKGLTSSMRGVLGELDDVTARQLKGIQGSLDLIDNAKNKADLQKVVKRIRTQIKNISGEIGEEVPETANRLNDALLQIQKEVDGFATRAVDPQVGLRLASMMDVRDPQAAQYQLAEAKRWIERAGEFQKKGTLGRRFKVEKHFHYGQEADDFLNKVGRQTGIEYWPDPTDFRNPGFLQGKAAQYQDEWTDIMSRLKPGDITVIPTGSVAFGVNSPIKDGDLMRYIKGLKELPLDASTQTISLHDRHILTSPVGWFATKFAPLRAVMGEKNFRMVRRASADYQAYSADEIQNALEIGRKLGWTSQRMRDEHGPFVGRLLERQLPSDAPLNQVYERSSVRLVQGRLAKVKDTELETMLRQELNIGSGEAKNILKGFDEITQKNANILKKLSDQGRVRMQDGTPMTVEDFHAAIASDFMHNAILKKALNLDDAGLTDLAKQLGTRKDYLKAAAEGRVLFDRLFSEAGIDTHMYRAAYLPHYRQFETGSYKAAIRAFKDIGLDDDKIQKIFWANELQRSDSLVTYDQNFFNVASRYISGMAKQKFFRPVFDDLDKAMRGAGVHSSRVQVYEQVKRSIQGVPDDMQNAFDNAFHNFALFLGKDADAANTKFIGSLLAELQYSSGMGFNPFMPIRNLTQKALALSSISESGSPIEGLYWLGKAKMAKMANTDEAKKWLRLNDILTNRLHSEGLDLQANGIIRAARMMGASDVTAARMDTHGMKLAMKMFRWSDTSNVEDVFMAKAMYATSRGYSLADAVEMARATTMATQFMYGIDSPMLYKHPLGKQIGIFQSWPLNWAHMLWEQGTQGNMRRAASTVVTMAVASELLSMTGISMRSIHPTETVQGLLPLKMLEGERNWPLAFRSTVSVLDYMRALANGEEDAVDTAMNNFLRSAEGLVPYGAVTTRTLRFVDRMRHDWRDFADTGFAYSAALAPETRESRSRLVRLLGETESEARQEAFLGLLGTTTKSVQRIQDAEAVQRMDASYRRTRRLAVQAFIDEDYDRFQKLQEQLVVNFGQWIEPRDIIQELQYMGMTARERQTRSLPADLEEAFYENILDPRAESVTPWW